MGGTTSDQSSTGDLTDRIESLSWGSLSCFPSQALVCMKANKASTGAVSLISDEN